MKAVKIFLIDDDNIFVFLTKHIIEDTNLETDVTVFENGQVAINFLKEIILQPEQLPDIILLDLNMPVMGGWEFLEEYTKLGPYLKKQIPIYVVSSSISPIDVAKGKQIDIVTDFIIKPISTEQVEAIIEQIHASPAS